MCISDSKKTVKEYDLESHVKFLGDLSQTEIKDLMNKSKLLIHTSQYETFGLVAIEANSMGVPILSINTGSLIELIENNNNGYFSENVLDSNANNFVNSVLTDDDSYYVFLGLANPFGKIPFSNTIVGFGRTGDWQTETPAPIN